MEKHDRLTPESMRLLLTVAALYLAQGIPFGVAMEALPTLLRKDGASLAALAWLPLVGLPWVLKVLWAPWVDNLWGPRLGRRRSWILPMQAIVILCLLGVAVVGLNRAPVVVGLCVLASLASATQDTATDGLAAERFGGVMLARANALQVACTMIGFFVGGSGALILSGLVGRAAALVALAAVVAVGFVLALAMREAPHDAPVRGRRASLFRLLRRPGAGSILATALFTALTAASGFGLAKLWLVDAGWPLEQIGLYGMVAGASTIVVGCGGAAWLIGRIGLFRVLTGGVMLCAAGLALWLGVATGMIGAAHPVILAAMMIGAAGSGSASVGAMTLAMQFAARDDQAGTDMTAVQSSRDLGEIGASSVMTGVAAAGGYRLAFIGGLILSAVALGAVVTARRLDGGGAQP
ncbi:RhtX/FptX family siderophore transporter [Brevundimonas sp. SL130]|uniref:RhtX/FptX family siderophore transporter n=1 Tax=Brevundimonas sp. SL130 TaxID=2995143 RepID=UPI00226C6763|nr:RhtX/FptX family siderophore transporter [Brevundimonas sp. SL130]WAC61342.1 RhtX/FptX family siderophore transporter [Brevundimonas sp. SL130]